MLKNMIHMYVCVSSEWRNSPGRNYKCYLVQFRTWGSGDGFHGVNVE